MREFETLSLAVMHDFRIPLDAIEKRLAALAKETLNVVASQNVLAIRDSVGVMDTMIGSLRDLYFSRPSRSSWRRSTWERWPCAAWNEIERPRVWISGSERFRRCADIARCSSSCGPTFFAGAVRRSLYSAYPRWNLTGGASGEFAVYSVQDNGTNVALEYAGKLFYVFEQIQEQTEHPGIGVELAIRAAHRDAPPRQHLGRCAPAQGRAFSISLPLGDAKA